MAAKFNKTDSTVVDHYLRDHGRRYRQEGRYRGTSLAGHLKLGKLIALYDDNGITIDGRTDVSFTEDVLKRYEAYGWHGMTQGNTDVDTSPSDRSRQGRDRQAVDHQGDHHHRLWLPNKADAAVFTGAALGEGKQP